MPFNARRRGIFARHPDSPVRIPHADAFAEFPKGRSVLVLRILLNKISRCVFDENLTVVGIVERTDAISDSISPIRFVGNPFCAFKLDCISPRGIFRGALCPFLAVF